MTGSSENTFWPHFTLELMRNSQRRYEAGNVDELRFKPAPSIKAKLKNRSLALAASVGFHRRSAISYEALERISKIEGLDRAYDLLADQPSKDLFVQLLAYRVLGHRHVRLPLNCAEYWKTRRSLNSYVKRRGTINQIPILGSLDLCEVNGVTLHTHAFGLLNTFLLEQYRCPRAGIGVREGDTVIDAGGCWGDTAMHFAQQAAKVYCFECIPSNIGIIQENLRLNPQLASKIVVIPEALWDTSGERLTFNDAGPGSGPSSGGAGISVETKTLDDFVSENSLKRIDFIKMDIEGSEPRALAGAERTIRSHRPQLAISIYHDPSHFASIPNWLASLGLEYQFYLGHFTIFEEETVLFARPAR